MGAIIQQMALSYTATTDISEHRYEHRTPIACCITSIPVSINT